MRLLRIAFALVSLARMKVCERVVGVDNKCAFVFRDGLIQTPQLQVCVGQTIFKRINVPLKRAMSQRFAKVIEGSFRAPDRLVSNKPRPGDQNRARVIVTRNPAEPPKLFCEKELDKRPTITSSCGNWPD